MKITIKSTVLFFWISFGLAVILSTFSAKLKAQDLYTLKRKLGAGVNISLLEQYWKSPNDLYKTDLSESLKSISKQGFKTIRLPVAFDLFLQPQSFNLQKQLLEKLDEIYKICNSRSLNLIITYHYGKLTDKNTFTEIDRISWMWKQIQRYFSGKGYGNLYFEIYNEPTLSNYQWKETITTLVQYLRFEDANRIYIIGGTNYNNIDQLKEMGKITDNKLFYTIHFYEPYIFTHQGAEWTGNKSFITNIPYPYQEKLMPKLLPELKGTSTEMDYNKYAIEGSVTFLKERFAGITQFCKANNMPLICTEAGVINLAEKQYRENYLTDITSIMIENGIQCILWDYDDKFSIKESDKKVMPCLKNWIKDSDK